MGENIKITIFNYKIFAALNIYLNFAFNITKIKKEQENKENTSGKNAFICFFSISLSIYNKTETSDGEARRNHPIPTG